VYWTGPASSPDIVDGQDHPDHRRSFGSYEVESVWLTQYWFRLGREQRAIRAQMHTHPGTAFHSATDDHWPVVAQPGFVSIVIPNFARGRVSLEDAWVGRLATDGRWQAVPPDKAIEIIQ